MLCNTFPGVRLDRMYQHHQSEADTPIPEETVLTLMTFEERIFTSTGSVRNPFPSGGCTGFYEETESAAECAGNHVPVFRSRA